MTLYMCNNMTFIHFEILLRCPGWCLISLVWQSEFPLHSVNPTSLVSGDELCEDITEMGRQKCFLQVFNCAGFIYFIPEYAMHRSALKAKYV